MNFYIADTHFNHPRIVGTCHRPFYDVSEMNATIIRNWHRKVKEEDDVYILGDFLFGKTAPPSYFLDQVPGHLHFVIGNHDWRWISRYGLPDRFESVSEILYVEDGEAEVTMCHYPLMTWSNSGRENSYMVHGHIHNGTDLPFWPLLVTMPNILNAGVDINGFAPVTFEELKWNNRKFKENWLRDTSSSNRDLVNQMRNFVRVVPRVKW